MQASIGDVAPAVQMAQMSEFARTILINKNYAHIRQPANGVPQVNEEWEDVAYRVAASVVKPYFPQYVQPIRDLIYSRKLMPGGRYLYAAGRKFPATNNCFLLSVGDSREEWSRLLHDVTSALMVGGGIGVTYSQLRPEGAYIAGLGGESTGPVALMNMVNEAGRYIRQGGSRRSAIWAGLNWKHPDIFKFIHQKDWAAIYHQAKTEDFNFPAPMDGTNISVALDDAFFTAYHTPAHSDHAHAQAVYNQAIASMLRTGEPGFSVDCGDHTGEVNRNACLTGDTLVAVADGRGAVQIKDLVGRSTQVYASDGAGNIKIGTLKNVRVTRRQAELVKVTLDNGTYVRLTPDHEVMLANGSFVPASTLRAGMALMPFSSEIRQKYRRVRCRRKWQKQCSVIMGRQPCERDGMDIHHVNGDHLDDRPENLKLINHATHAAIKMMGARNPAHKHDLAWRVRKSLAGTGVGNGRYTDGKRVKPREMTKYHDQTLKPRGVDLVCEWCGKDFIARPGTRACSKTCGAMLGNYERKQYIARIVESVQPAGVEDVYDGSVAGLECFAVVTTQSSDLKTGKYSGVVVHNCTEVVSADNGDVCNLASINLSRVASLEDMYHCVELGTIFLLCGTLYSKLPVEYMYRVRDKNRRLGLGLMGVHAWLLGHGYSYGPCAALDEYLDVYQLSGAIANRYADRLGISRPVATRSIAPTGTISIIAETTSGIEPVFAVGYKRRYLHGKEWKYQYVVDAQAQALVNQGVDPALIEDAYTLAEDIERRIAFQAHMQQYVDQGISSTINLPAWGSSLNNPGTVKQFSHILLTYLPRLRGITAYPDGARGGQPLTRVSYTEAVAHLGQEHAEGGVTTTALHELEATGGASCSNGFCSS